MTYLLIIDLYFCKLLGMTTIDQVIAEKISSWVVDGWPLGNLLLCVIALVLSVILCGIIGIERERRGRSAGLRTHLLVGVGSCMLMIISIYGFPAIFQEKRDVARLAAQIVAGVGFLGAGAIIHRNSGIKGLTTAATVWIVMAIGLACGSMNFILAIGSTLLIVLVLTVFRKFESKINKKAPLINVRAKPDTPLTAKVLEIAHEFDCMVDDLQVELLDDGQVEITFLAITKSNNLQTTEFVTKIGEIEGVNHVGIINSHGQ